MMALQYSEYYLVTTIYPGSTGVTKQNGKIKQIAETKTVSAIFVISLSDRIMHIVGLRAHGKNLCLRGQAEITVHLSKE